MTNLFFALVILLLAIALFDLVVGVSNDAVNFLSSALGSKAGSFALVMAVASVGVFIGAASSGGMMEVAKRGLFNPALFSFKHLIYLYVVVMLTDIFLLDFFNSMRLPTSTTVSIVFELLGASLAISFLIVLDAGLPIADWFAYVNFGKAGDKISAIFVSVGLAFIFGWLIQWLVRGLFSFDYRRYNLIGGSLYGALASCIVLFFIINVAFKNSPLGTSSLVHGIANNSVAVYGTAFLVAFAAYYLTARKTGMDLFVITTLMGTFALAMAFASNDLVNFVGVPIAGLEAYNLWQASGAAPDEFMLAVWLGDAGATTANPAFLVIAGVVMVVTLWTSDKARNVIKTSVDLSSQHTGSERFRGNDAVRLLVGGVLVATRTVLSLVPTSLKGAIERRYIAQPHRHVTGEPAPAFDRVRASTTLIVAAALISIGTLLKLPLSTTFVSFMVLMGTSLADRAWDRDTAVYRVAGVLTVISGWFLTAATAMALSAVMASIVYLLDFSGIVIVLGLVALGIYVVNRNTDSAVEQAPELELPDNWYEMDPADLKPYLTARLQKIATIYADISTRIIRAIINEDRTAMQELKQTMAELLRRNRACRAVLTRDLASSSPRHLTTSRTILDFSVEETELLQHIERAMDTATTHVLNLHNPLQPEQYQALQAFGAAVSDYLDALLATQDGNPDAPDAGARLAIIDRAARTAIDQQILGSIEQRYAQKSNELFYSSLLRNLNATASINYLASIAAEPGDSSVAYTQRLVIPSP